MKTRDGDDTEAAREAFEVWFEAHNHGEFDLIHVKQVMFNTWLAASRSIPAAAALLREAGWTVEEPDELGVPKDSEAYKRALKIIGRRRRAQ